MWGRGRAPLSEGVGAAAAAQGRCRWRARWRKRPPATHLPRRGRRAAAARRRTGWGEARRARPAAAAPRTTTRARRPARGQRPTRPGVLTRPKYAHPRICAPAHLALLPGYVRLGARGDAGARARPHGDWSASSDRARPRPNTISGPTLRAAAAARPPHAANFTQNCGRAVMRYVLHRVHLHLHYSCAN